MAMGIGPRSFQPSTPVTSPRRQPPAVRDAGGQGTSTTMVLDASTGASWAGVGGGLSGLRGLIQKIIEQSFSVFGR